jgi:hypothetical protein
MFNKAVTTRGVILREATWEVVLSFATLVLGPQCLGAASSTVRAEDAAIFDLWHRGHLDELLK